MQWWCVATEEPWTWAWRPLLGVWAMLAGMGWGYARLVRGARVESTTLMRIRRGAFGLALFLLWGSLDWPLGPLGAGYLASIHMIQYLVVGVAAPALLLLSVPASSWEGLRSRPRLVSFLAGITQPMAAFVLFSVVMTVTHWPGVVDALMPSQLGSFLIDAAWLAGGLVFWWPMIAPVPDRQGFHPLARIGYLALNAFLIRPPFAMMIFAENPLFRVYELAPPPARDPLGDQQLAGVLMEIGNAWIMLAGVFIVFRLWMRSEGALSSTPRLP